MAEDWIVEREVGYIVISGLKSPDESEFVIRIIEGEDGIDEINYNVDIEVVFEDDKKWVATVFTIENVKSLLNKYKGTGECASGLYFWASDMIIVENLTVEVIIGTVLDMLESSEFELAFDGPYSSIGE